ncbi:MAG: hypothetical protein WDN47_02445 [Candidatus Doudnabacteria bacterium]
MNTKWHEQHPFPEKGTEQQKEKWREDHKQNCNCGKMMLPYRQKPRE